jgi:hypothetical protein
VYPAAFNPACDAYAAHHGPHGDGASSYFNGWSTDGSGVFANLTFWALEPGRTAPYPLELFKNITNQPIFGNGSSCDSQVRLFNTSISQGQFAPIAVRAKAVTNLGPLHGLEGFGELFGYHADAAFIETNDLPCQSLQGYSGTGPGD